MGTRSLQVARLGRQAVASAPSNEPAVAKGGEDLAGRFHFWRGVSGKRYIHTVYSLIECPMLHRGTYVLVRRDAAGRRFALRVGATEHEAPSLNLADIRRRGAQLGADEVHVHLLADTPEARRGIERDLHAGQFRDLVVEPASTTRH